jgi:hypothetical protein
MASAGWQRLEPTTELLVLLRDSHPQQPDFRALDLSPAEWYDLRSHPLVPRNDKYHRSSVARDAPPIEDAGAFSDASTVEMAVMADVDSDEGMDVDEGL